MKKLFSILVAVFMLASLTVTAGAVTPGAAQEGGEITLDNPMPGVTYTAYKIFDVVYNSDGAYSYTINSSNPWFATVNGYEKVELTASKADANVYVVKTVEGFTAAGFANVLRAALDTVTDTGVAFVDNVATVDLGYYFVAGNKDGSTQALCNLTTTAPTVTIHDKNDVPFEKTASAHNVEVGETIGYTITGKVPDTTGFTSYVYTISDTMTTGLTFNKNVEVTVGGVALDADKYTLTYNENNDGFSLTIDVMELQDKVLNAIVVTYSAKVNADAVSVISENDATLVYSNDPTSNTTSTLRDK